MEKLLTLTCLLILFILTCLLILSSPAKEIPLDQLVKRQDVFYEINTTTPFTGTTVGYYNNGQLKSKANYKNGKYDDLRETYFENGQLKSKENYKDGERDGLWESYYENGELEFKGNYNDGEKDGLWEEYYLASHPLKSNKGNYKNGKKDGLWELHYHVNFWEYTYFLHHGVTTSSGRGRAQKCEQNKFFCPFYTRQNYKDGKVKGLFEHYRLNGQLLAKGNSNDKGQHDGPWEYYYEDGQLASKENYKNGKMDGLREYYYEDGQLKAKANYKDGKLINE